MIVVMSAWAVEPSAHVMVAVGGRSAPESAIQLAGETYESDEPGESGESEDPNEVEPAALGLIDVGGALRLPEGFWVSGRLGAWLLVPESESSRLTAMPALGWSVERDGLRFDLAGRYLFDVFPGTPRVSSGRLEGLAAMEGQLGAHALGLSVLAVDRHFYNVPQWGLFSVEAGPTWRWTPSGPFGLEAGAGGQFNEDVLTEPGERDPGWQLRAHLGAFVAPGTSRVEVHYRPLFAFGGHVEDDAIRPQFTPFGDYAADADALSQGGFVQHRVDLAARTVFGRWTLLGGALGRLRTGGATGTLAQTGNLHLGLDHRLKPAWTLTATAGVSAAALTSGGGYVDVYGWAGIRWDAVKRRDPIP